MEGDEAMKKLLVLGAGIYQVPLIKKAKEMGLYVIVASKRGNYPGFQFADEVANIDTTDNQEMLKFAKEKKISGVVVCGTDVCVPTLGYLCDNLNLTGPSYASAMIAQNKLLMKEVFRNNKVRSAEFAYVDINNMMPVEECEKIGFPVIFKSIDSSGSRGITKVNSLREISYAYEQVKCNTKSDKYLIEKYLDGEEFGVQAFVFRGEMKLFLPHGDYVFQGDTGVPVGHFAPYDLADDIARDVKEQLSLAIGAMGVDNCAINADFIFYEGKAYVLEIGARAGATCLAEMTGIYFGFDYYEKIIQAALGVEPDFLLKLDKPQPSAEMLIVAHDTGIIKKIRNENKDKRILEVAFDYTVGDYVRKFQKGPDRIGDIIVVADTVEEAKQCLQDAINKIEIIIE